ncbi:WxcM-like, C-terminal [Acinetobacter baumannii]|nr:WxcM-like, C-terminal [Acinetobacter baumannii]
MLMDNGLEKQEVIVSQSNKGLLIPPMVWHEMHDFSNDCILLVIANDYYDESDYIRDYENFLEGVV